MTRVLYGHIKMSYGFEVEDFPAEIFEGLDPDDASGHWAKIMDYAFEKGLDLEQYCYDSDAGEMFFEEN
jgi:hypothetical protein